MPHLRFRWVRLAFCLCLCGIYSSVYGIEFSNCELHGSNSYTRVSAECATFSVLENSRDGTATNTPGHTIELFVSRIKSLAPTPAADALTIINGGPGGSSTALLADLFAAFQAVLRDRDIVVIDQRGTGQSNPLDCPDIESISQDPRNQDIGEKVQRCLANLSDDPRYYTTSIAVEDLEALRVELGYPRLNLYGVSYGSRVALHYLRRFPGSTRSLIIDGVVPPTLALGPDIALNGQDRLRRLFNQCALDPVCNTTFGDLESSFQQLADQLKARSVPVEFPNPKTGVPVSMDFDYGHLATVIRLLSYAPETAALIPLLIQQALVEQNFRPIAAQAYQILGKLTGSLSYGMHNAVVCTEDVPFYQPAALRDTALQDSYLGPEQVLMLQEICRVWPAGILDPDFKQPIRSDVPMLILSGEFDPITPPAYGAIIAEDFPNSRHIIAPGQGHGIVARGCIPSLATEFLRNLEPAKLDTGCVERLAADAFFINLMGPAP